MGVRVSGKNPVRVGIAGLGRSGWGIHRAAIEKLPGMFAVAAACDPEPERRAEAEMRLGCRAYPDVAGLLSDRDVELVIVATPSHLHAQHSIAAVRAGKDVLVEKPLALSPAEADATFSAAAKAGRRLLAFHNFRFFQATRKVLEIASSGVLGRLLTVRLSSNSFNRRWDWQTLRDFGGGYVRNVGPHYLDVGLQLFGPSVPEVFCAAHRAWDVGDAEDHIQIMLRGTGAPIVDIEVSTACAYPKEFWHISGTRGGLHGSQSEIRWKYMDPAGLPERSALPGAAPDRKYFSEKTVWQPEQRFRASGDDGWGGSAYHRALYAHLREEGPAPVPWEDARRIVEVTEQCYAQLNLGIRAEGCGQGAAKHERY